MKIYKNVCAAFDLIDNDNEWHIVFTKITLFEIVIMFRDFMMTILIEYFSIQFARLWKIHKDVFFNDYKRIINRDYQRIFKFNSKTFEVFAHQNQQLTFFLLIDLLNKISRKIDEISLIAFDLFEFDIDFNEYFDESNKLIRKQLKLALFQNDVDDV